MKPHHNKLNLAGHVCITLRAVVAELFVLSLALRVGQQVLLGVDVVRMSDRVVAFNVLTQEEKEHN
jgi:hypothetical protein